MSNCLFAFFQIAYRIASDKFPGKLSELFLVLSDNIPREPSAPEGSRAHAGRGHKHRLDEDQMSVGSGDSKRPDFSTSAEKTRNKSKNKPNKPSKNNK